MLMMSEPGREVIEMCELVELWILMPAGRGVSVVVDRGGIGWSYISCVLMRIWVSWTGRWRGSRTCC